MINLMNLDEQGRKEVYQLFNLSDFKKCVKTEANPIFIRVFKHPVTRVDKKELIQYVEQNYLNPKDRIITIFLTNIDGVLYKKFKNLSKVNELVDECPYDKLDEKKLEAIYAFEDEYVSLGMPLSYTNLVKGICGLNTAELMKQMNEKQAEVIVEKMEELQALEEVEKELRFENKELAKTISALEKDLRQANKECDKLNEALTKAKEKEERLKEEVKELKNQLKSEKKKDVVPVDASVRIPLSTILDVDVALMSFDDMYVALDEKEEEAIEKQDYVKWKYVLAAKFALVQVHDGGGHEFE